MAGSISGPARRLVDIVVQAVDTAINGGDAATYGTATTRLAREPAAGRVLGDVLRSLLEDIHPDGFSSEDITLVVGRCYRAAVAWLPPERVDVTVLLATLTGAVGIHEPDLIHEALDQLDGNAEEYRDPDGRVPVGAPAWPDYAWHAPLLVADLLPFAPATLAGYLDSVFAEYAREAREEQP